MMPPQTSPLPVEYTAEAVRGYRLWRTPENKYPIGGLGLTSVNGIHNWVPGVNVARCPLSFPAHPPPRLVCRCGFYAWHYPQTASLVDNDDGSFIFGVVEGGGHVINAQFGWRAEKALIVALFSTDTQKLDRLGSQYPDVTLFTRMSDLVRIYPSTQRNWLIRRVEG